MQFSVNSNKPFSVFFSGVQAPEKKIVYQDGKIIYQSTHPTGRTLKINFFKGGKFETNFNYTGIKPTPLQTITLPELPAIERNRLRQLKVIKNPNLLDTPARIFTLGNEAILETGKVFDNLILPYKMFILFHEEGHFYYETEWKADAYAFYMFIKEGGNPSQAVNCLIDILTTKGDNKQRIQANIERIYKLFNIAKNE